MQVAVAISCTNDTTGALFDASLSESHFDHIAYLEECIDNIISAIHSKSVIILLWDSFSFNHKYKYTFL